MQTSLLSVAEICLAWPASMTCSIWPEWMLEIVFLYPLLHLNCLKWTWKKEERKMRRKGRRRKRNRSGAWGADLAAAGSTWRCCQSAWISPAPPLPRSRFSSPPSLLERDERIGHRGCEEEYEAKERRAIIAFDSLAFALCIVVGHSWFEKIYTRHTARAYSSHDYWSDGFEKIN